MNDNANAVKDLLWGIERETHRVKIDGGLSEAEHPASLSAPSFTKDFAESQLELVTAPRASIEAAVAELESLTETARGAIGGERLWPFSMPPLLSDRDAIPLARMGDGDEGRMAERYRAGLSTRYGMVRQLICGVHVNVSFGDRLLEELRRRSPLTGEEYAPNGDSPCSGGDSRGLSRDAGERDVCNAGERLVRDASKRAVRDAYYLRLARNLVDDMPSLVMLFGATPFDVNARDGGKGVAYSIRNSPAGYARGEYRPFLNLDSIAGHLAGIRRGMRSESDEYRKMGLVRDGRVVQLNARVFQKEKEFYAPIRFKRTPRPGEGTLAAIEKRGVEYMELRFFDVDPFSQAGVSTDALALAQLFILDGLFTVSSKRPRKELIGILERADEAALSDPFVAASGNLHLARLLRRIDSLEPLARREGTVYERALETYRAMFARPGGSPSARIAKGFIDRGLDWNRFGTEIARRWEKGAHDGITA